MGTENETGRNRPKRRDDVISTLDALYRQHATWQGVERALTAAAGRPVNRGFLSAIHKGAKPAPTWLVKALGLSKPRMLWQMSSAEIAAAFANRKEMQS